MGCVLCWARQGQQGPWHGESRTPGTPALSPSSLLGHLPSQEAVGAGEYGALFASEDSQSLAKVVIDLLRDDEKRRALAESGREYAQRFDWSQVANQIYEIYEKALASGETLKVTSESRAWDWLLIREND